MFGYHPIPERALAASLLIVSTRIGAVGVHVPVAVVPAELYAVAVYVLPTVYMLLATTSVIDALTTDAVVGGTTGSVALTEGATEPLPTAASIRVLL
jgi:hypothetical protein